MKPSDLVMVNMTLWTAVLSSVGLSYGFIVKVQYAPEEKAAAVIVSQAHKVQHATNLYIKREGSIPTKIDDLIGEHLSSIPQLPVGADGAMWTLEKAKDYYNKTVDIVTIDLPLANFVEYGLSKYMCDTINKNSAGLVFCTVSQSGIFNEKNLTAGEGSGDSAVDAIDLRTGASKAKIHMII